MAATFPIIPTFEFDSHQPGPAHALIYWHSREVRRPLLDDWIEYAAAQMWRILYK
jgi:hypothetical protein